MPGGFFNYLKGLAGKPVPPNLPKSEDYGKDIHLPKEYTLKGLPYHPSDIEESRMEKMIKTRGKASGSLIPEDEPYLEQYLHPDRDVLQKQPLRPTITTDGKGAKLDFRKPAIHTELDSSQADRIHTYLSGGKMKDVPLTPHERYNVKGLGKYWYNEQNPDYDSIYDEWDFDTNYPFHQGKRSGPKDILPSLNEVKDWATKKFMQNVGKPYAVYERVPKGTHNDRYNVKK